MKTLRVLAALVLVVCAILAAYYSYSRTLAPPTGLSPSNAGPPAGIAMPRMGGPPAAGRRKAAEAKGGTPPAKGAEAGKPGAEKGGQHKTE